MYIIVFCGYEGIDNILWAGSCREEAIFKMKEARHKIDKLSKLYAKYHDWDDEKETYVREPERYYDILDVWPQPWKEIMVMDDERNTDRLCVMKSQGEWGFRCACKDLGVSPKESWLY